MEHIARQPSIDEVPALRDIWRAAFGGDDDEVFFCSIYDPALSVVVGPEGAPVAAGYLIPSGNIVCGRKAVPCAMIYAVATLPGHRGLGHGAAVVGGLVSLAREEGYPAVVLCPSEDSLFGYYSRHSELVDWFYTVERTLGIAPMGASDSRLTKITIYEYNEIRKYLLYGKPHIDTDLRILEYQNVLCGKYGGGFFRSSDLGRLFCAIVEVDRGGTVCIKELLALDGIEAEALEGIASIFPAKKYIVRTPAVISNLSGSVRRFGMIAAPRGLLGGRGALLAAPWYGPALD